MLYKIQFRICCPFDSLGILPPQESEIRCSIIPGKAPVFSPPSPCGRCGEMKPHLCEQCTAAINLMFRQGLIAPRFYPSQPVCVLPDSIRPSLSLLSAQVPPAEQ